MSETKQKTKPETKPDTKPDTKPEATGKTSLKLRTHMIFEGVAKQPGDMIDIPTKDMDNWTKSGLCEDPAE
jgi:hypothetical protein